MNQLPEFLKQGERARLLPVVAETSREGRVTSILLALLPKIPDLASSLLGSIGVRVGKRTRIETFTEVVFRHEDNLKDRPDGLLIVDTGKGKFTAIIEAKIGKASLSSDQVSRYLELARANSIDAVITLSNQFVTRADHPPVEVSKSLLKKTNLYHWPWMWVLTRCQLLQYEKSIADDEQRFLLKEFVRFLDHPSTGVESFTQMDKSWKDVVRAVGTGAKLSKFSPDVEKAVAAWIEEQRDVCLLLSRRVGKSVDLSIDKKLRDDPVGHLKHGIDQLVETNKLSVSLKVPDTASDIDVCADIARKSITVSMQVRAPQDRKSTKARLTWLTKMLKVDDDRLIVRAMWPSRRPPTQASLLAAREKPECLQTENRDLAPHSFEVALVEDLGGRFIGSRTFIEDIEKLVPEFYELVGQYLRAWQAPPPKPISLSEEKSIAVDPDNSVTLEQTELATPEHSQGHQSPKTETESISDESASTTEAKETTE